MLTPKSDWVNRRLNSGFIYEGGNPTVKFLLIVELSDLDPAAGVRHPHVDEGISCHHVRNRNTCERAHMVSINYTWSQTCSLH